MRKPKYKVLIVDDEKLLRWSIVQKLKEWGFLPFEARNGKEALTVYASRVPDIILLDLKLPDMDGIEILKTIHTSDPDTPIIIITAFGGIEDAVQAMKASAHDFFSKPIDFTKLQITLERLVENIRLKRKIREFEGAEPEIWGFESVVAESKPMREVLRDVKKILEADPPTILITGESGTGKDLLARVIHHSSERAPMPFLVVDCASLPDSLVESELFGYERGAFTDAKSGKKGAFLLADGGTLVLDEIGEMKPNLQAKLLRVLEDRTFRPLGGVADINVNVCVIATTNRDLESAVHEGLFRSDLYFRLNVVRIHIPPLRDRKDDILPLARHFITEMNRQFRRHVLGLTPASERALLQQDWPGNVRELRNLIERAMILHNVEYLDLEHLSLQPPTPLERVPFHLPAEGIDLEKLEDQLMLEALKMADGNKSRAARFLNLSRDAFRYRLKRLFREGLLKNKNE